MISRAMLFVVVVGGCGSGTTAVADAPAPDSADAEMATCVPPGSCDWLDGYQRGIVGALAGETEITPGLRLAHRATVAERAATRQYLLAELTALGLQPSAQDYGTGQNVLATLPATTGTGGLIVVGSHFDGVIAGPAAADNATGVAVVLAAARYLRDVPVRHHPIVFALFDEEELGLRGSKAYAAELVAAGTEVTGVHVFDMLSFDGDGDHAVELWSPSPPLAALYEAHGPLAGTPIQPVAFKSSDHQAFLDVGLPTVGVCEEFVANDHTPHYHKATDTFDHVSFEYLALATNLAFTVLEDSARTP
ncbi:MAG: aminopeptidase [Deltaproteobacteria bacterium]|nr:aminopeptidase [Deltaproteobacteria bacterium]